MPWEKRMHDALCCRNLSFRYDDAHPVFTDLCFSLQKGEAVLLMGPSGCGKSTLAYCLAGLYPEYAGVMEGQVQAAGETLEGLSPSLRAGRVSIMFQNPDNQFCMGRVDHEILFALENINYRGDLQARMKELLAMVGLDGLETKEIHTLSGGTKQKLALATALATEAKALILDEPFANIDPAACAELAKTLAKLHQNGLGMLIVDHRMKYWRPFIRRVVLMDSEGCLSEPGIPVEQLDAHRGEFERRGLFWNDDWLLGLAAPRRPEECEPAVKANGLSVRYQKQAVLSDVAFTAPKGTVTAILGGNGAGKSTLLSAVAGLVRFQGELYRGGEVGLVFQNPKFQFLTLTVREEILYTLRHRRKADAADALEETAGRLLEEFGLSEYGEASPYALSQGQQRRLAILSMLAGDRPILLLDEPTYAQDEKATRFIMELLRRRVEQGLTVIMATHDTALAKAFAHQVFYLEDGALRCASAVESEGQVCVR